MSEKRGRFGTSDQTLQGSAGAPESEDDGTWNSLTQRQRIRALCSGLPGDISSPELKLDNLRVRVVTGQMAG